MNATNAHKQRKRGIRQKHSDAPTVRRCSRRYREYFSVTRRNEAAEYFRVGMEVATAVDSTQAKS
jgi:hypothetical protein